MKDGCNHYGSADIAANGLLQAVVTSSSNGFLLLEKSKTLACDADADPWQFALTHAKCSENGLCEDTLRWLAQVRQLRGRIRGFTYTNPY